MTKYFVFKFASSIAISILYKLTSLMKAKYWDISAHVRPQATRVNTDLKECFNLPWKYKKWFLVLFKGPAWNFSFAENLASISLNDDQSRLYKCFK